MKRFVLLLLASVFTASGIANATPVSAPKVPAETVHLLPDKRQLVLFTEIPLTLKELVRESVVEQMADRDCGEWVGVAFDVGWPVEQIPRLLEIMYRESRCNPEACSESDSGRVCRDWGLMQINEYSWRTTIRKQGMRMSDMWNPELNLRFALWLYTYSLDRNGDGWQPWAIPHN